MSFGRTLAVLVIVVALGLGWWLFKATKETPAPGAAPAAESTPMAAPKPAPVIVQTPPPQPVQVVAPVVAPAPVQQTAPEPVTDAPVQADPRTSPDTALTDFLRIVDSGDYITAAETYVQVPPNMTAAQFVGTLQQSPNFQQLVQMVTDTARASQNITPVMNAAGDALVYNFPSPVDGQSNVRWRKVNGNWYLDGIGN